MSSRPSKKDRNSVAVVPGGNQSAAPTTYRGPGGRRKDSEQRLEVQNFLSEYRCKECLWNTNRQEYSVKKKREEALQELARKFGMPVEQVKRKIHTIRSTYNQMRLKVLQAEADGKTYRPLLSWYNDAEFLSSVIQLRKIRNSLEPLNNRRSGGNNTVDGGYAKEADDEDEEEDAAESEEDAAPRTKRKRPRTAEHTSIRVKIKEDNGELTMEESLGDDRSSVGLGQYAMGDEPTEIDFVMTREGGECTITATNPSSTAHSHSNSVQGGGVTQSEPASAEQRQDAGRARDEMDQFAELLATQLRALPNTVGIETMLKIQSLIAQVRLETLLK